VRTAAASSRRATWVDPGRQRGGQQIQWAARVTPVRRAAGVLDPVGSVGDQDVGPAPGKELQSTRGVSVDDRQRHRVPSAVPVLGLGERQVEAPTGHAAVPLDAHDCGLMLESLALDVGLHERRVGLEVLRVDVDPRRVVAVRQGLVERGAPPAQWVCHEESAVEHLRAEPRRPQGHVQQELGELLVGLPGVLLDGQQVVIEPVEPAHGHRPEQVAVDDRVQRIGRRQVRQEAHVPVVKLLGSERQVVNATDRSGADVPEAAVEHGPVEHRELGDAQAGCRLGIHAVRRRQAQQQVLRHVGHPSPRWEPHS